MRRYGKWAGNREGIPEDVSCCIETVHSREGWGRTHQCHNRRGHGPEGLYCKTHDPAAVAARDKERAALRAKAWERELKHHSGPTLFGVLRQIAEGHNDPRALAAAALDQVDPKWREK